ncbi:cysteate racemase [Alkalithermobacter paradoxus]|uniref:Aspartate racemase n=1 Tax=Alkalithermobacter paradoxus TaxID=29349 RepID=A0A1V4I6H5_9FIRM|nr:aspartate racemase [[Clostridium] thermoalcaliphilum]
MNDKVIGIIGGMGPEATANLYMKIIKATKTKADQDHFRVIIDSNPKIPDRTQAILYNGKSPVDDIVKTAKNLELIGVDVGCIPCMTSHYFIESIQESVSYPIINAFEEVNKYILANYPRVNTVGVLATSGTVKTGLFEKYLDNINIIYPDNKDQEEKVMQAIYGEYGIKSGNLGEKPLMLLKEAATKLVQNGAELLISGCTEIGLVLKQEHLDIPIIDPMEIIAQTLVKL